MREQKAVVVAFVPERIYIFQTKSTVLKKITCTYKGNGQINGYSSATEILISFVIWFSWRFRSWMVLCNLVLDQFGSSFARYNVLSIFEFDADWFIDFSTRILINGFYRSETFFWSFKKEPRSRFMLELMMIFFSIKNLKLVARARLIRWFNGGSDDVALLPLFLIRSVRMLETIACSGTLVWLFSPAWDAVKLTLESWFDFITLNFAARFEFFSPSLHHKISRINKKFSGLVVFNFYYIIL